MNPNSSNLSGAEFARAGLETALQFEGIDKSFFGVRVLKGVSFAVPAGRTIGLVGENGAGKSTLMNILGGNHQPDGGRMRLLGKEYQPRNPREAAGHGIAFIHQELNLFGNLTIAENLFLTSFPTWAGKLLPLIRGKGLREKTRELLEMVELRVSPETLVEQLSAGERQLVEIAKALSMEPGLVIFDEPTTSLTSRETERLFRLMERLRQRGISMIYISHILGDVFRVCDEIVVLRDGEKVGAGRKEEFTVDRLVSLMVGRSINQFYPPRTAAPRTEVILGVKGLSQSGMVEDIRFELHRGEVLGISGLMGSGRSELARILFGLDRCERGEIFLRGKRMPLSKPRWSIENGMAFLTENRREEGLCMEASIQENIALVSLRSFSKRLMGWLNWGALVEAVRSIRQAVGLTRTARDEQAVKTLSGGNQQKVVLAKWLLHGPEVLILDEPTRGIDVGAKSEIYNLINELAGKGAGILVISSEIEELTGICDRILVMSHGEITDHLDRAEFDPERILHAALRRPGSAVAR
jgi:ribose transport system ATP-binding protein